MMCQILCVIVSMISFLTVFCCTDIYSRIDETVVFNRLQRENMDSIAKIQLDEISKRLLEGQNMTLDVSEAALRCISDLGYDVRYGARPLKRVLGRSVLNPLSRLVLEGSVLEGDTVRVRTRGEVLKSTDNTSDISWISSSDGDVDAEDRNDILILRNHDPAESDASEADVWDDDEYLLEDGTHHHR